MTFVIIFQYVRYLPKVSEDGLVPSEQLWQIISGLSRKLPWTITCRYNFWRTAYFHRGRIFTIANLKGRFHQIIPYNRRGTKNV